VVCFFQIFPLPFLIPPQLENIFIFTLYIFLIIF